MRVLDPNMVSAHYRADGRRAMRRNLGEAA